MSVGANKKYRYWEKSGQGLLFSDEPFTGVVPPLAAVGIDDGILDTVPFLTGWDMSSVRR